MGALVDGSKLLHAGPRHWPGHPALTRQSHSLLGLPLLSPLPFGARYGDLRRHWIPGCRRVWAKLCLFYCREYMYIDPGMTSLDAAVSFAVPSGW